MLNNCSLVGFPPTYFREQTRSVPMAYTWFRQYGECLNDPKIQTLPDFAFKCWSNALFLACNLQSKDGNIGTLKDVSFAFRETEERVSSAFHVLLHAGLIVTVDETFHIVSWQKRQYKSDTSTDRVKRYRKRCKTVSETPPDTDTDTDTEKKELSKDSYKKPKQVTGKRIESVHDRNVFLEEYAKHCEVNHPCLDPPAVWNSFYDYWSAKSGADATKRDWLATWRTWCKNSESWGNDLKNGERQNGKSKHTNLREINHEAGTEGWKRTID